MSSAALPLILLSLPSISYAFTWNLVSPPTQCGNFSVAVSGGGTPPYRVLVLPFGATTLGKIEARTIIDQPFPASSPNVTFQLKYPENSQFVAVVSDATGFGSGGTSVVTQVGTSNDSSCFDPTQNVSPKFVFSIQPLNQIVQCVPTRIWWDNSTVQGVPNFLGVIPGGQSFVVPEGDITNVQSQGTGFSWTPSIRGGTTLILVGGDDRGNGSAGSALNTVSSGIDNIDNCLTDNSPSSTAGTPAGGALPTATEPSGSGGSSGGGSNTGAIVGGVVGGVVGAAIVVLLFFLLRRRNQVHKRQKEQPIDLFHSDEGDDHEQPDNAANQNELPQYYQPEPFLVTDPTINGSSVDGHTTADHLTDGGRPLSGVTSTSRSGTPDLFGGIMGAGGSTTSGGRKGVMRQMRPVNIIQHDDAGPSEAGGREEEPDTVELPPAYTNIRK